MGLFSIENRFGSLLRSLGLRLKNQVVMPCLVLLLNAVFAEPYFNLVDLLLGEVAQVICALGMKPPSIYTVILAWLTGNHKLVLDISLALAINVGVVYSGVVKGHYWAVWLLFSVFLLFLGLLAVFVRRILLYQAKSCWLLLFGFLNWKLHVHYCVKSG